MAKNITEVIRGVTEANMPTIVLGRILKLSPWKIQLVDDQNIILSGQSLIIPERIRGCGLAKGDRLYMLAVNHCKIYYVLDRA